MRLITFARNWYLGMWAWACEQRMFWWTLLVLLIALALIHLGPLSISVSARIRYVGTTLQVLGIGTVWWGFEKTRKLFEFDYTAVAVWHWLRRVPYKGPKHITAQLSGTLFSSSLAAAGLTTGKATQSELEALAQRVDERRNGFKVSQLTWISA